MKDKYKVALKLYFASILIYGIGILICRYLPYYKNYLTAQSQQTLLYLYVGYIILSPIFYYFRTTKYSTNKPLLILQSTKRIIRFKGITKDEKVAWLFLLVKIFFLPLMINFFHQNWNHLVYLTDHFQWYAFLLTLIFTIDTLIFALGYSFEFRSLNNVVKSVEPTIFGWAVALASYPPFNSFIGKYIAWGANDYAYFGNDTITTIMRIVILIFLGIYLAASFALGPKASNLTNRGIVSRFPYSIVRHPAYISKNIAWWLTLLPVMNWTFALGMGFWSLIYFFRAITEERHLLQDPDYKEYCKKVKWKFIPYVI